MLSFKPAHNLSKGQMEINSFPGEALFQRTAQIKLVWYQGVSFVELFVSRTNPAGFSSAIEVFRQEAAQMCKEELGSRAYGLRHPGRLNLPVLAQQSLAVGFTRFCPSATVLCSPAWGNHSIPSGPRGCISIYLPGFSC